MRFDAHIFECKPDCFIEAINTTLEVKVTDPVICVSTAKNDLESDVLAHIYISM